MKQNVDKLVIRPEPESSQPSTLVFDGTKPADRKKQGQSEQHIRSSHGTCSTSPSKSPRKKLYRRRSKSYQDVNRVYSSSSSYECVVSPRYSKRPPLHKASTTKSTIKINKQLARSYPSLLNVSLQQDNKMVGLHSHWKSNTVNSKSSQSKTSPSLVNLNMPQQENKFIGLQSHWRSTSVKSDSSQSSRQFARPTSIEGLPEGPDRTVSNVTKSEGFDSTNKYIGKSVPKSLRPLSKLFTSSIRLFDGTTPILKSSSSDFAISVDSDLAPSAFPPSLTKATSVGGLTKYHKDYVRNRYKVKLPPGVMSSATLAELRRKPDHHGDAAKRRSESVITALRRQQKIINANRITLPSLKHRRASHQGLPLELSRSDASSQELLTTNRREILNSKKETDKSKMLQDLSKHRPSDNAVTRKYDNIKANRFAGRTRGQDGRLIQQLSEHAAAGRTGVMEHSTSVDDNLQLSQSMREILRLNSDGEEFDVKAPPYITTVGRPVDVNNHVVLVGRFRNPDGTFRKAVVLGTLHAKAREADLGSGDSAMTLPSDMIPGMEKATSHDEDQEIVNEDLICEDNIETEFAEGPKLKFIVPFRNLVRSVRNRFRHRNQKWLSDSGISTNYEGNAGDTKDQFIEDHASEESGLGSDEDVEVTMSQLDASLPLVIGRGRPACKKKLCPKPETCPNEVLDNTLNVIPTAKGNSLTSPRKVANKMQEIMLEIKNETKETTEEWKILANEFRKYPYSASIDEIANEAQIQNENQIIKNLLHQLQKDSAKTDSIYIRGSYSLPTYIQYAHRLSAMNTCDSSNTNSKFYKKLGKVLKGWIEIGARGFGKNKNAFTDENIYDDLASETLIQECTAEQELAYDVGYNDEYDYSSDESNSAEDTDSSIEDETQVTDSTFSTTFTDSTQKTATTSKSSFRTSSKTSVTVSSLVSSGENTSTWDLFSKNRNTSDAASNTISQHSVAPSDELSAISCSVSHGSNIPSGDSCTMSNDKANSLSSRPSVSGTSSHPSGKSSHPSRTSSHPSRTSSHPSGKSSHPSGKSSHPNGTSSHSNCTSPNLFAASSYPSVNSVHSNGPSSHPTLTSTHSIDATSQLIEASSYPVGSHPYDISIHSKGTSSNPSGNSSSSHAKGSVPSFKSNTTSVSGTSSSGNNLNVSDEVSEATYGTGDNLGTSESTIPQVSAGIVKKDKKVHHACRLNNHHSTNFDNDTHNPSLVCIGRRGARQQKVSDSSVLPRDSACGDVPPRKVTFNRRMFKTLNFLDSKPKRKFNKNASRLFSFALKKHGPVVTGNRSCIDLPSIYESRKSFLDENSETSLSITYRAETDFSQSLPTNKKGNDHTDMYNVRKTLSLVSNRFLDSSINTQNDEDLYMSSVLVDRTLTSARPRRTKHTVKWQSTGRTKVTIGRPRQQLKVPGIRTGPQSDHMSNASKVTTRISEDYNVYDIVADDENISAYSITEQVPDSKASLENSEPITIATHQDSQTSMNQSDPTDEISTSELTLHERDSSDVSMWSGTDPSSNTNSGTGDKNVKAVKSSHTYDETAGVHFSSNDKLTASFAYNNSEHTSSTKQSGIKNSDSKNKPRLSLTAPKELARFPGTVLVLPTAVIDGIKKRGEANDESLSTEHSTSTKYTISKMTATSIGDKTVEDNLTNTVSSGTSRSRSKQEPSLTGSKELSGFPGSIVVLSSEVNNYNQNEKQSSKNVSKLLASSSGGNTTKANSSNSDTIRVSNAQPKTKLNLTSSKKLPDAQLSTDAVQSERNNPNQQKKKNTDEISGETQFFTATSSSHMKKFLNSGQSLGRPEHRVAVHREKSKTDVPISTVYGQNPRTIVNTPSLGESQSLFTVSTSAERDVFGETKKQKIKFPRGLIKLGAMDYSSTNVSQLTSWWDETSGGEVTRQQSCDENMPPRLYTDEDEVRARGTDLGDRNTHATLLYLRGDGILLRNMQLNDRDKIGDYRSNLDGRLKLGNGRISPTLLNIQCMDSERHKLTRKCSTTDIRGHNKRLCDDPRCLNEKCSSSTLEHIKSECPAGFPCRKVALEETVTLKDVTDLIKRNRKDLNLYRPDAKTLSANNCERCPQHENRFYPYFNTLFEQRAMFPMADRIVDFAMIEGKETFKHYFPLYSEDDVNVCNDVLWFDILQHGVARFLAEESINDSWLDLQSGRHFECLLNEIIKEEVDVAIANEYARNCISDARRIMIVQRYIEKNTPPENSPEDARSAESLLPMPDCPDNRKYVSFCTTVPDDLQRQERLSDQYLVKRDGADDTQMLVPAYILSKIKASKIVNRITERSIDYFLSPPSVYETASDSSLPQIEDAQSDVILKRSEYTNLELKVLERKTSSLTAFMPNIIDGDVKGLLNDIVAAVVLSEELQLNAFTSKPGADLAYGLAQTFSNTTLSSTSVTNVNISDQRVEDAQFVQSEEEGARITIYKIVCALAISEELKSMGFSVPLKPIIQNQISSEHTLSKKMEISQISVAKSPSKNSNKSSLGRNSNSSQTSVLDNFSEHPTTEERKSSQISLAKSRSKISKKSSLGQSDNPSQSSILDNSSEHSTTEDRKPSKQSLSKSRSNISRTSYVENFSHLSQSTISEKSSEHMTKEENKVLQVSSSKSLNTNVRKSSLDEPSNSYQDINRERSFSHLTEVSNNPPDVIESHTSSDSMSTIQADPNALYNNTAKNSNNSLSASNSVSNVLSKSTLNQSDSEVSNMSSAASKQSQDDGSEVSISASDSVVSSTISSKNDESKSSNNEEDGTDNDGKSDTSDDEVPGGTLSVSKRVPSILKQNNESQKYENTKPKKLRLKKTFKKLFRMIVSGNKSGAPNNKLQKNNVTFDEDTVTSPSSQSFVSLYEKSSNVITLPSMCDQDETQIDNEACCSGLNVHNTTWSSSSDSSLETFEPLPSTTFFHKSDRNTYPNPSASVKLHHVPSNQSNKVFGRLPTTLINKFGKIAMHLQGNSNTADNNVTPFPSAGLCDAQEDESDYVTFYSTQRTTSEQLTRSDLSHRTSALDEILLAYDTDTFGDNDEDINSNTDFLQREASFSLYDEDSNVHTEEDVESIIVDGLLMNTCEDYEKFAGDTGTPNSTRSFQTDLLSNYEKLDSNNSYESVKLLNETILLDEISLHPSGMPITSHKTEEDDVMSNEFPEIHCVEQNLVSLGESESAMSVRTYCVVGKSWDQAQVIQNEEQVTHAKTREKCKTSVSYERSLVTIGSRADARVFSDQQNFDSVFETSITIGKRIQRKLMQRGETKARPSTNIDEESSSHLFVFEQPYEDGEDKLDISPPVTENEIIDNNGESELELNGDLSTTAANATTPCTVEILPDNNTNQETSPHPLRVVWELSKTCLAECASKQMPVQLVLKTSPVISQKSNVENCEITNTEIEEDCPKTEVSTESCSTQAQVSAATVPTQSFDLDHDFNTVSCQSESYTLNDLLKDLNKEVQQVVQTAEETGHDVSNILTFHEFRNGSRGLNPSCSSRKEGVESAIAIEQKLDDLQDLIKDYIMQAGNKRFEVNGLLSNSDSEQNFGKSISKKSISSSVVKKQRLKMSSCSSNEVLSKQLGLYGKSSPKTRVVKRLQRSGVKQYSYIDERPSSGIPKKRNFSEDYIELPLEQTSSPTDSTFSYSAFKKAQTQQNTLRYSDMKFAKQLDSSSPEFSSESELNDTDLWSRVSAENLEKAYYQNTHRSKKKRWYRFGSKMAFLKKTLHPSCGVFDPNTHLPSTGRHRSMHAKSEARKGVKLESCLRKRAKKHPLKKNHRYRVRFERTCSCSNTESDQTFSSSLDESCGSIKPRPTDCHFLTKVNKPKNTPISKYAQPKLNQSKTNSTIQCGAMDSKVCAGNVKLGESSAEQDLNSDVQHWPSEPMETTTLPCHRLPLFSPITDNVSEAETSLSEPRQTDLRNSIHGGVVVVTRSSSTVSAHLKTNQPDESVQLTVPILREYFEDLETGQSQFSGEGNVFTPRYSCSLDEDSDMVSRSSSRTVKLSGSENVSFPHPSSGKTIILINRGMDPPPAVSEVSLREPSVPNTKEYKKDTLRRKSQDDTERQNYSVREPKILPVQFEDQEAVLPSQHTLSNTQKTASKSNANFDDFRQVSNRQLPQNPVTTTANDSTIFTSNRENVPIQPNTGYQNYERTKHPQQGHMEKKSDNWEQGTMRNWNPTTATTNRPQTAIGQPPAKCAMVEIRACAPPMMRSNRCSIDQPAVRCPRDQPAVRCPMDKSGASKHVGKSTYDFITGLPYASEAQPISRRRRIKKRGFRPVPKKTPLKYNFEGSENDSSDSSIAPGNVSRNQAELGSMPRNRPFKSKSVDESSLSTSRKISPDRNGLIWSDSDQEVQTRRRRARSLETPITFQTPQEQTEIGYNMTQCCRVLNEVRPRGKTQRWADESQQPSNECCESNRRPHPIPDNAKEKLTCPITGGLESINFLRGITEQTGSHRPRSCSHDDQIGKSQAAQVGVSSSSASRSNTVKLRHRSECDETCCLTPDTPNVLKCRAENTNPSSSKTWRLLPNKSSLISVHRMGTETISRIWQNVRPAHSSTSQDTASSDHQCELPRCSVSKSAAKTVTSLADAFVRVVAVVTVLYFALHENIFLFVGEPPT